MRVRLFVDPSKDNDKAVCQDLEYVKTLGKRIKNAGLKLILDFHYSDTWADPGKQWTPDAWKSLTDEQLNTKIYEYTKDCLEQLTAAGATPDFIQTGNEISFGMLWGTKAVADGNNTNRCYTNSPAANWTRFISLLKQAGKACREWENEQQCAVIDLENMKYLGRATGNLSNLRHLLVKDGVLFASINRSGIILRMPLDTFLSKVRSLDGDRTRTVAVDGWQSCKVPSGARTINISPKGDFIFVACNSSSCLAVVDAVAMKLLGTLPADSYPVGLDISDDGKYLFTTSQGRGNGGGNAVDIFEVEYK